MSACIFTQNFFALKLNFLTFLEVGIVTGYGLDD
jgi:hypothetical protein